MSIASRIADLATRTAEEINTVRGELDTQTHTITDVTGLQTALDGKVGTDGTVLNAVKITQAAYDALGPGRPATTFYVIVG